jgi:polyisoprenoid-binding protein YceI
MKKTFIACALALALPVTAFAQHYQTVIPAQSDIAFTYKQMGVSMDGKFKQFASTLSFDPAKPEQGKAIIEVALDSIDTGTMEGDDEVVKPTWLNIVKFPKARFESESIKSIGEGRYEVTGSLQIKGKSEKIKIPVTFTKSGNQGQFAGKFTISRNSFAIGEGSWAAPDIVAPEVIVSFKVSAVAAK